MSRAHTQLNLILCFVSFYCECFAGSFLSRRISRSEYTNQLKWACTCVAPATANTRTSSECWKCNQSSRKNLPIGRWHRTMVRNEMTWQLIRFVGLRLLLGCTTNAFDYRLKSWMPVYAFEIIRTTFRPAKDYVLSRHTHTAHDHTVKLY